MRLIIFAAATAATLGALSPALAVNLPGSEPEKLTALPDDWLDEDVDANSAGSGRTVAADASDVAESGSSSDERLAGNAEECRQGSGATGAILGAVAGGLLGNILDGGRHRAAGTIVGAGGGALLGREVEKRRGCK
ncbi:glycine zipper 2TM domain-containing protein [Sphingomonas sp. SRS2]|uniref:glycine zipper 2TM domain-containing protein n=1 Tax=Sphingomonas sp. SRS2 TaxID=133190 RepID=UPI0006184A83|nr:glycine zipper 2TM domain-containing protein [Sphingomonas sp. SRS2]KKC24594.1 hypothetical protein WP12_18680 [Sphingomonas sp. SRS2]